VTWADLHPIQKGAAALRSKSSRGALKDFDQLRGNRCVTVDEAC
jgi:hypothetical protein